MGAPIPNDQTKLPSVRSGYDGMLENTYKKKASSPLLFSLLLCGHGMISMSRPVASLRDVQTLPSSTALLGASCMWQHDPWHAGGNEDHQLAPHAITIAIKQALGETKEFANIG